MPLLCVLPDQFVFGIRQRQQAFAFGGGKDGAAGHVARTGGQIGDQARQAVAEPSTGGTAAAQCPALPNRAQTSKGFPVRCLVTVS